MDNIEKILLFTHGIDIDGYGCAVLARLAWKENVDIVYADNIDLDQKFDALKQNGLLQGYDKIFVTDHCFSPEKCQEIDQTDLRHKIKVIDHHKTRQALQDQFKWVMICDQFQGKKECGTSLFFQYLLTKGLVEETPAIQTFVELTRLQDTWLWTTDKNGEKAHRLDTLSKVMTREQYVELFTQRLSSAMKFYLLPGEEEAIDNYLENLERTMNEYLSKLKVVDFDGQKAGFVEIFEEHKSEITQRVRQSEIAEEIDFLLMPILDGNSVSLRNVNPDCDVSKIAQKFGGGGHTAAASFPKANLDLSALNENQ